MYCIPKICPLPSRTVLYYPAAGRVDEIVNYGVEYFGVSRTCLASPDRHQNIVEARHIICNVLYSYAGLTLGQIGKRFNRDHTTIIAGNHKVAALLTNNEPFRNLYYGFVDGLKGKGII